MHTPLGAVRGLAQRLDEAAHDYDPLLAAAAGRRFVLLGEATHGTREFYRMRAEITRRLIAEQGFDAVAIEGDWPDAWRANRFVAGETAGDATSALEGFQRFPRWMWRNREFLELITWLRQWNTRQPIERRAGLYGLDLYSLYRSAEEVVRYLEHVDPEQAEVARERYARLDHVGDPQVYGYQAALSLRPPAHDGVLRQLAELRARGDDYLLADGLSALDAQFAAERNAAAVVNAEVYYRGMFASHAETWNLRDAHMRDTLLAVAEHGSHRGGSGRVVVWAHNSHVGDARHTEFHRRGECSLGQLLREAVGDDALLVGFTTYTGHVAAASRWNGEVERKRVRPALSGSCEHLFHASRLDRFYLPLTEAAAAPLREGMLQRAIGVIYLPESERASHYFETRVADQFDALFHLDETTAVEPLETPHAWHGSEAPEPAPV
ncbi:MAG: erythromycin esterase family protein [Nevskia sp.]|nr:erythromycin esterase family protein [Nevskia sp.]